MKICPNCKVEYPGGEIFCPVDGSRLSSPSQMYAAPIDANDPLIGTILSERYRIIKNIGEGGMGIVYEAEHVVIEKRVALKVLRDDFSKRPEVVERFRQEAKSASRIGHENIVDISDFGETPNGQSYFVMEHLQGEDVANLLAKLGTLPQDRAVNIVVQCCKALGAAHAKGIVHRDMKPENIFLVRRDEQEDFVKIVDFGIAKMSDIETEGAPGRKLTKTGMIFGTPEYMSPEQAAGKPLDHRVDVYALGMILFEMLAGRVPFVGDTFMGILTQHMFEDVPPLRVVNPNVSCSEELEVVVMKALAKDPDERYQTMDELGRAIAGATDVSGLWTFADPTNPGYGEPVRPLVCAPRIIDRDAIPTTEFGVPGSRRKTGLMVAVAGAVLVAAGIGGYLAFRPPTTAANGPDPILTVAGPGGGAATEQDAGGGSQLLAMADLDAGGEEAATDVHPGGPTMVTVEVVTRPAGAEVQVDGRQGVACGPTPCSFQAEVGQSIDIRARRGAFRAFQQLVPQAEDERVQMTLARRPGRQGAAGMMTAGMTTAGMMTTVNGDLKVPDIFR